MFRLICLGAILAILFVKPTLALNYHVHRVNGYRVILVNTGAGNEARIEAFIPRGMLHDEAVSEAGISHFIEHAFHDGSVRFPGATDFNRRTTELGVTRNATTSFNWTRYYANFHPSILKELFDLFGSMLSYPLFPADTLELEKGAVIQELDNYRKTASWALFAGIFYHLLPDGHPWKKFPIGTEAQIRGVSRAQVQDIFLTDYRPEEVTIVVTGNFNPFDGGPAPLNRDAILSDLGESLIHHPDFQYPAPRALAREAVFPSMIDDSTPRVLEMQDSDGNKMLGIFFDMDKGSIDGALASWMIFIDYLSQDMPGSLVGLLKEKGWVTGGGAELEIINNRGLFNLNFNLTSKGEENRDEIIKFLMRYFKHFTLNGLTDEEQEFLIASRLASLREGFRDPEFVSNYIREMTIAGVPLEQALHPDQFFREANSGTIQTFVGNLRAEQILVSHIRSRVDGAAISPVFNRPFKVFDAKESLRGWKHAIENRSPWEYADEQGLRLKPVPLFESRVRPVAQEPGRDHILDLGFGYRVYLREEPQESEGLIQMRLKPTQLDSFDQARLCILKAAFEEDFAPELAYLRGLRILSSFSVSSLGLVIQTKGNPGQARDALMWLLKKFLEYQPSHKALELAKEEIRRLARKERDAFPASRAAGSVKTLVDASEVPISEIATAAEHVKFDEVDPAPAFSGRILSVSDPQLGLYGAFSEAEARDLGTQVKAVTGWNPAKAEARRKPSQFGVVESFEFWRPSSPSKEVGDIGGARLFSGPPLQTKADAAVRIIQLWLNDRLYEINRKAQKLGYIHGAFSTKSAGTHDLALYGGVGVFQHNELMRRGWEEAMSELREGKLQERFEAIRKGMVNVLRILRANLEDQASRYFTGWFLNEDPQYVEAMLNFYEELTYEDAAQAIQTYFGPEAPSITVEVSKSACAGALVDLAAARARMKSKGRGAN